MEEQQVLKHFHSTVNRSVDGQFVLRLPVKITAEDLGNTLKMDSCRFLNVERKLQRDNNLRDAYVQFMQEYLRMGCMEKIVENKVPRWSWYLPHHAVIKTSSLTTKVRVVFDVSARSTKGISLNDILMCGPAL